MKKLYFSIAFILTLGLYAEHSCPYCDSMVIENQYIYQDDHIVVLYNDKPLLDGHCLIIPKRHIERFDELSEEEALAVFQAIKDLNSSLDSAYDMQDYILLDKTGPAAGQNIPHMALHYIPRKENDISNFSLVLRLYKSKNAKPMNQDDLNEHRRIIASHYPF